MSFGELIKKHAGTILTFIATGTFVATVYEAVKNTPKALELIEKAREEKCAELTKFETVQVSAPAYIPAIVLGTLTIGCMFGANILNVKQQASLMSAYAVLDQTYKKHKDKFRKYRDKVTEIFGEEAGLKVSEAVSHDEYPVPEVEEGKLLRFRIPDVDGTDIYIEKTMDEVIEAEYFLNREMNLEELVSVNKFLEFMGVDPNLVQNGDLLGWNALTIQQYMGYCWVDFDNRKSSEPGTDYDILWMVDPTPGFTDYEENVAYIDHKYLDMCYA